MVKPHTLFIVLKYLWVWRLYSGSPLIYFSMLNVIICNKFNGYYIMVIIFINGYSIYIYIYTICITLPFKWQNNNNNNKPRKTI